MVVKNERFSGDSGKGSIPSILAVGTFCAVVLAGVAWANDYDNARKPVQQPYDGPPVAISEGAPVRESDRIGSTLPCGYVGGDHVAMPELVITPGNSDEVLGYVLPVGELTLAADSNCDEPYYVRVDEVTAQPTPAG